jgi:hypothetical protein
MSQVEYKLGYTLTENARIAQVKEAGIDSPSVVVTIKHGDAEFARAVDMLGIPSGVSIPEDVFSYNAPGEHRNGLAAGEILDLLESQREKKRAEDEVKAAEREAAVVAIATADPRSLLRNRYGLWRSAESTPTRDDEEWSVIQSLPDDERCADTIAAARELCRDHNNRLDAIKKAEREAEKAERKAGEEVARREINDWIGSHGSNRLKRIVKEGIEHKAVYRDERLALDRPGWEWLGALLGTTDDARNPPEEAFITLDEARKLCPGADLQRYTVEHEHDENCCGENDCPEYDHSSYVAEDRFLGEYIVYGAPIEGVDF